MASGGISEADDTPLVLGGLSEATERECIQPAGYY